MTQLEQAKNNIITAQMRQVAVLEQVTPELIRKRIAKGRIVLPYNKRHRPKRLCAIGQGLCTKVNANIGTSGDYAKIKDELKKMRICVSARADTVMDLSTGGDIAKIRRAILRHCSVPMGTVPIYQTAIEAAKKTGSTSNMSADHLLRTIAEQAEDGVDFFTLHCGITKESIARMKKERRITGIVSRGGAILVEWMTKNKKENPLYANFKQILKIARKFDVTISLGDGMRPGSVADATDRMQVQELILLGELAQQARENGVQVMIEGPGHVPLDQIAANVLLEKRLCDQAPFYVLGPLVTDVAPGYDHITAAIGAAIAAFNGADFICYVTPSEHLRLPTAEDVREGVIAARIAAHAADLAKGMKKAVAWDAKISRARKKRDWRRQIQFAIDPERPKNVLRKAKSRISDVCTMCSQYCSLKIMDSLKAKKAG